MKGFPNSHSLSSYFLHLESLALEIWGVRHGVETRYHVRTPSKQRRLGPRLPLVELDWYFRTARLCFGVLTMW